MNFQPMTDAGTCATWQALLFACLASPLLAGSQGAPPPKEQIGTVLGKPVYREDIRSGEGIRQHDELHRLFTVPVLRKYQQAHKEDIEPTEAEIEATAEFFDRKHRERIKDEEPKLRERLKSVEKELTHDELTDEQRHKLNVDKRVLERRLKPPGRLFAVFVLQNWKFQRHLYDEYDGGRILWQQAGLEAFDAMHNWLKAHEAKGDFKITDPKLRSEFYAYWTTMKHGAFLTDDEERIRTEFLEPEWAPKRPQQK